MRAPSKANSFNVNRQKHAGSILRTTPARHTVGGPVEGSSKGGRRSGRSRAITWDQNVRSFKAQTNDTKVKEETFDEEAMGGTSGSERDPLDESGSKEVFDESGHKSTFSESGHKDVFGNPKTKGVLDDSLNSINNPKESRRGSVIANMRRTFEVFGSFGAEAEGEAAAGASPPRNKRRSILSRFAEPKHSRDPAGTYGGKEGRAYKRGSILGKIGSRKSKSEGRASERVQSDESNSGVEDALQQSNDLSTEVALPETYRVGYASPNDPPGPRRNRAKKRESILNMVVNIKKRGVTKAPSEDEGQGSEADPQRTESPRDRARKRGSVLQMVSSLKPKPNGSGDSSGRRSPRSRANKRGSLLYMVNSLKGRSQTASHTSEDTYGKDGDDGEHEGRTRVGDDRVNGSSVGAEAANDLHRSNEVQGRANKRGSLANIVSSLRRSSDQEEDKARRSKSSHSKKVIGHAENSTAVFDKLAAERFSKRGSLLSASNKTASVSTFGSDGNRSGRLMKKHSDEGNGKLVSIKMGGEEGYDDKIASILYSTANANERSTIG